MKFSHEMQMRRLWHAVLALPLLYLASCGNSNEKVTPGGAAQRNRQVPVEVKVTSPRLLINEIFTTGSLQANEKVELRSEVSGRIISIPFEEGSYVQTGQLLLKINDLDLQAQLKKAKIQSKLAEQEEYRKAKLLEIKAISQEEYDVANNQLQSIKAEISLIMAQIDRTEIHAPFSGRIGLRMVSPGSFIPANTLIATLQQLDPVKIEFSVP
jgi:membrane fusion protein (multidrug efflux system)